MLSEYKNQHYCAIVCTGHCRLLPFYVIFQICKYKVTSDKYEEHPKFEVMPAIGGLYIKLSLIMRYDNMHPREVMHAEQTHPITQRELLDWTIKFVCIRKSSRNADESLLMSGARVQ